MVVPTPKREGVKAGPGASLHTTGGHDDCMRPLPGIQGIMEVHNPYDPTGPLVGDCIELPFQETPIYSHPNPFFNTDKLAKLNGDIGAGKIIEPQTLSALIQLDRTGYKKRLCLAPELTTVAEKLFLGGKFVAETFLGEFCIFRIGEIPQLPRIELASLAVPSTPNFSGISDSALLGMNPDLSLDILLKPEDELFDMRTSLRIPVMRNDKRLLNVPKSQREKTFHMFVVNYAGKGEESRYFRSYVDRWSLQSGIKSAIKQYSNQ